MDGDIFPPQGGFLVNKDSKVLAAGMGKPKICAFLLFRSTPAEYVQTAW